jgi:chromosomal replication initiator protein
VSVEAIQAAVATHFGITVDQLTSSSRRATINWARQVAMSLVRDLTDESLPSIGRAFGGRNHATVHNALRRVSDRLAGDDEAVEIMRQLRRRLGAGHDDRIS